MEACRAVNASASRASPRIRLHEIDGLRALAIILVMTHHFATSKAMLMLQAGGRPRLGNAIGYTTNSGVELFFVLSGVVLLRPYLRGLRPFHAPTYFRRRVERLWPPYLGALCIGGMVILVGTMWPTWYSREILPRFSVLDWARQLPIMNFGWTIYNLAWWSLTPELTFYILAPAVLALFAWRALGRHASLILLGTATALTIILWNDKTSMTGVQTGARNVILQFIAYVPCFFAGAMLAKEDLSARMSRAFTIVGVIYFAVAIIHPSANIHAAFAFFYAGLVSLAIGGNGWLNRQLVRPSAVWLGERSYSLFLTHFSMLYLADYVASRYFGSRTLGYDIATRLSAAIVALGVAMILFWVVERRFARNLVSAHAFWPWQFRLGGNVAPPDRPTPEGVSEPGI